MHTTKLAAGQAQVHKKNTVIPFWKCRRHLGHYSRPIEIFEEINVNGLFVRFELLCTYGGIARLERTENEAIRVSIFLPDVFDDKDIRNTYSVYTLFCHGSRGKWLEKMRHRFSTHQEDRELGVERN